MPPTAADGRTPTPLLGSGARTSEGNRVTEGDAGVKVSGAPAAKPTIELPGGDPPTALHSSDLAEGDGPAAQRGATVTTHYVGVSWLTGRQFDSSWDRGKPLSFGLGRVIEGWQEGIPGMRPGGRRLLVIPPAMAYGAQSPSPDIAASDTLVFVIDLVAAA